MAAVGVSTTSFFVTMEMNTLYISIYFYITPEFCLTGGFSAWKNVVLEYLTTKQVLVCAHNSLLVTVYA